MGWTATLRTAALSPQSPLRHISWPRPFPRTHACTHTHTLLLEGDSDQPSLADDTAADNQNLSVLLSVRRDEPGKLKQSSLFFHLQFKKTQGFARLEETVRECASYRWYSHGPCLPSSRPRWPHPWKTGGLPPDFHWWMLSPVCIEEHWKDLLTHSSISCKDVTN